jgi:hypothetical protein
LVNHLKDAGSVAYCVVVPEAQHAPALGGKEGITPRIRRAIGMLPAVEFYNEPVFDRGEISDIVTDWHLVTEFDAAETTIAKEVPHRPFGVGLGPAERTGRLAFLSFAHASPPVSPLLALTPTLSRKRERE